MRKRALGGRFVPWRFTLQSRNWLVDHARYLVEKGLVELPVEPETVRRAFSNVQRVEGGYHHPNRRLTDVFDAVALALSEVKVERPGARAGLLLARRSVAATARRGRALGWR